MELNDKVVVITGSSKGFGKALAKAFLSEGSKVVINSTEQGEVVQVAKEIGALGVFADVTKEEEMKTLAENTIKEFGKIDIWINNAGLWVPHSYVEDFDMQKIRKMLEVNVIGTINGSRVALRHMKEKNSGVIMNIISDSALVGRPMSSVYSASKWAVNGFTKGIRDENKEKNVSILSVFPGGMKTDIFGKNQPDNYNHMMDTKDVAKKIIDNLKLDKPKEEMIIQQKDI